MGQKDKDFCCPDCFGKVFHYYSKKTKRFLYYCFSCDFDSLAICDRCFALVPEEIFNLGECPFCLMEKFILQETDLLYEKEY